jgi:YegS/Rv2252/BmrU family lipid kinase
MYYAKVIVNPQARGGTAGKMWPIINKLLQNTGIAFDHDLIQEAGQGIELARKAVEKGYNLVIAVGGDGTVNEVVNGLVDENGKGRATLGIIGAGTQNDIAHMLNIPWDYIRACQLFEGFKKATIDLGAVEYTFHNQKARRYYMNTAGVGFVADVIESSTANFKLKAIGGGVPYAIGLMPRILSLSNKDLMISIDGETRKERDFSLIVNNGRYLGGGRVFPNATPYDGLLDVAILGDMSKVEALLNFPFFYTGTSTNLPKVKMQKARTITVDSIQKLPLQIDGELIGETPATFWVVPSALQVAVKNRPR